MIKQMNKKQLLIGGVAAAVLVLGGGYAMVSSSGKKAALAYYDDFKERYFLEDVLSEGDISYSAFSGNLTVAEPEIGPRQFDGRRPGGLGQVPAQRQP